MTTAAIQEQLREVARRLLAEDLVKVVIGYGQTEDGKTYPVFVTNPDGVRHLVWNDQCFANLAAYLKRRDIRALGKPAVVVKGCDERALVVLEQESQLKREDIYVIGVPCQGVGDPVAAKCALCVVHTPRFADEVVGEAVANPAAASDADPELEAFLAKSPQERWAFWTKEFERCFKCYACRESCPMCYCPRCIADKNRPTVIDTSATLKGNLAWHVTRAFHLAGRCVGCDECTRACPAGINLRLLNQSLARAAREQFDYRAGMNPETPPVIGAYSMTDKEEFIR